MNFVCMPRIPLLYLHNYCKSVIKKYIFKDSSISYLVNILQVFK